MRTYYAVYYPYGKGCTTEVRLPSGRVAYREARDVTGFASPAIRTAWLEIGPHRTEGRIKAEPIKAKDIRPDEWRHGIPVLNALGECERWIVKDAT